MPVMKKHDFNNDGADELAIMVLVGSGAGISVMELHIRRYCLREAGKPAVRGEWAQAGA